MKPQRSSISSETEEVGLIFAKASKQPKQDETLFPSVSQIADRICRCGNYICGCGHYASQYPMQDESGYTSDEIQSDDSPQFDCYLHGKQQQHDCRNADVLAKQVSTMTLPPDNNLRQVSTSTAATNLSDDMYTVPFGTSPNCWSLPKASDTKVRGQYYLEDGKKVPSGEFLFPTRGVDLCITDACPVNVGRNDRLLQGQLRKVPTFIVNLRFTWGILVLYFEIPSKFLPHLRSAAGAKVVPSTDGFNAAEHRLCKFLTSSEREMAESFKMIPNVVEGPWLVRNLVTNTPVIIGTKVKCQKFYQPAKAGAADYLEIDLDIGDSIKPRAKKIVSVCRSHMRNLTMDFCFVVEGNSFETLPEQMLAGIRLHKLDSMNAPPYPISRR